MKNKLLSLTLIFTAYSIYAQTYQTTIVSGFNSDVIANGTGPASSSTSISVDSESDNFAFLSKDFKVNSADTPLTYGLPINGLISSAVSSTTGLSFQLNSYSSNNTLRLRNSNETGTLTLATPYAATEIYVLAVSGSGLSVGEITVNFQDGTSQIFTNINFNDWYNGSDYAIRGIGRINRSTNALEYNIFNPRIYQIPLILDATNQTKSIASLALKKTSTEGILNIFAISLKTTNQLSVSETKLINEKSIYPNPFVSELNIVNSKDIIV